MARPREYGEWSLRQVIPREVSPEFARDIMLDWFCAVHGPHFAATKEAIGVSADPETVKRSVKGSIRIAFKHHGGDYERPTRKSLEQVCEHLLDKSRSWGTPEAIVDRHRLEIMRVIERVPTLDA